MTITAVNSRGWTGVSGLFQHTPELQAAHLPAQSPKEASISGPSQSTHPSTLMPCVLFPAT